MCVRAKRRKIVIYVGIRKDVTEFFCWIVYCCGFMLSYEESEDFCAFQETCEYYYLTFFWSCVIMLYNNLKYIKYEKE